MSVASHGAGTCAPSFLTAGVLIDSAVRDEILSSAQQKIGDAVKQRAPAERIEIKRCKHHQHECRRL